MYRTEDPTSADLPPRWKIIRFDQVRCTVRMHNGDEIQYHSERTIEWIEHDCWNTWEARTGLSKKKMKKLERALALCEKIANDEPIKHNCDPFDYFMHISDQANSIVRGAR